jgi:hypothetical protein
VRDIQATGLGNTSLEGSVLPAIDVAALEAQERRAEEYFQNYKSMIGIGVTQHAQEIFDSLAKTMPCQWSGQQILCYRVKISPPYMSENCEGPDENELNRVKKVLDGERLKMEKKKHSSSD